MLVIWIITSGVSVAAALDWSGPWDTRWRGAGARVTLVQDGDRVTGHYPLYGGTIQAVAHGRELKGTWTEARDAGEFVAIMSPDGKSFTARFGAGEWWSGLRVQDDDRFLDVPVDQSSPAATLLSFLSIMNAVGPGRMELKSEATHLIDWGSDAEQGISRLDYVMQLFQVLDELTVHVRTLQRAVSGETFATRLGQAGSEVGLALNFRKQDGQWLIVPPSSETLDRTYKALRATRTRHEAGLDEGFQSPRDTLKSLILGFNESDRSSVERVIPALNLSGLSDLAKKYEASRLASYLKRTLDRLGVPIWQEIPDDPDDRNPYVYFEHPVGNITIAPVRTSEGVVWQFTPETLKKIRTLYGAVGDLPASQVPGAVDSTPSLYFQIREFMSHRHERLTRMVGPMEAWQWLGLSLALALAYALGRVVRNVVGKPLLRRFEKNLSEHPFYQWNLLWSLRLLLMGVTLRAVDEPLGLPDMAEVFVLTVSWSSIILSVAMMLLILVNLVSERVSALRSMHGDNITLVSLSAGIVRVAIVMAAILLLADVLEIPYQGVLAGLGIGGLAVALAAQSTLQNFISGITLYVDKPVAIGDYCRFGQREGTVEFIGMRSTRIRTLDRTLVTVPNSEFANMQIENYTRRDRIFLHTTLQVRYETTPDQMRFLLAELRKLLIAHPKVAADPLRVRFAGFGSHSLDIEVFCYVLTRSKPEFLAIREDIYLRMMTIVQDCGAQFAFPSVVHYSAQDTPTDAQKVQNVEAKVARWREDGQLPFPDYNEQQAADFRDALDFPPAGSALGTSGKAV